LKVLGKNIKELRLKNDMSANKLSHKLNVSQPTISLYEKGERNPGLKTLIKLAKIFNVSTDFLLGLEQEKTINNRYPPIFASRDQVKEMDQEELQYLLDIKNQYSQKEIKAMKKMMDVVKEEMDLYNHG